MVDRLWLLNFEPVLNVLYQCGLMAKVKVVGKAEGEGGEERQRARCVHPPGFCQFASPRIQKPVTDQRQRLQGRGFEAQRICRAIFFTGAGNRIAAVVDVGVEDGSCCASVAVGLVSTSLGQHHGM